MIALTEWIVIAFAALWLGCGSPEAPPLDAGSNSSSTSEALDAARVPDTLRHLTPLAREWGIGDDIERTDLIERSSVADREHLAEALAPHDAEITAWLDSFGTDPMPDEAAAFMYMQLAREEMR